MILTGHRKPAAMAFGRVRSAQGPSGTPRFEEARYRRDVTHEREVKRAQSPPRHSKVLPASQPWVLSVTVCSSRLKGCGRTPAAQGSADAPGPWQRDAPLAAQVDPPRAGVTPPSVVLERARWQPPTGSGPMDFLVTLIMYVIAVFLTRVNAFFSVNNPFPYPLL